MTYLLSLLFPDSRTIESTQALCYYVNTSNDIQSIRAADRANCHLERVVFPKERILFLAYSDSSLEVHPQSTVQRSAKLTANR